MEEKNKDLRFGVIGCGLIASRVHCPNMAVIPGARTVAYCDIDESKAEELLQKHGGEYTTTEAGKIFADKNIDGVLIQVGPTLHPAFVQAAGRAGKHIFVEKPIAVELSDAINTVRVVEESNVKFIFGTCNRIAPMVKMAKRMCPSPFYSYSQCAESISEEACHRIDLAVNLFHYAPLQRVYASGGRFWGLDAHLPADSFAAVLTFADGSTHTCVQHGLAYNPLLTKYHYQLFGKECCVYLAKRYKECHLMRSRDKVEQSWIFDGADTDRGPFGYMGHYDELLELVNCIRAGGNGTMTVRDAAYLLAVEKAILESIGTGQVVNFPDFLKRNNAGFLLDGKMG